MQAASVSIPSSQLGPIPDGTGGVGGFSGKPGAVSSGGFSTLLDRMALEKKDKVQRLDSPTASNEGLHAKKNQSMTFKAENLRIRNGDASDSKSRAANLKAALPEGRAAASSTKAPTKTTAQTHPALPGTAEKMVVLASSSEHVDARSAKLSEASDSNKKRPTDKKRDPTQKDAEAASLGAASNVDMLAARGPDAKGEIAKKDQEFSGFDNRKADKKDTKVTVVDLRMKPASNESAQVNKDAKRVDSGTGSQDSSVHLGARQSDSALSPERAQAPSQPAGSTFSDILSRHLSNEGAQEIVKAAQIILKDGDSGLIRLKLEPDSLGHVKIELKLTEKNITGRIIVETDEARNAFEKSLGGLKDAFSAGGFETSSLEVSVGGGETNGRGEAGADTDSPFFSDRLRELDAAVPTAAASDRRSDGGVSIWA